jgi:hypothetical protein
VTLYHGGTEPVQDPGIVRTGFGRDFGAGFYLTGIRAQAEKWARRQARVRNAVAIVSVYEYDGRSAETVLHTQCFTGYSLEWLDFVLACRGQADYRHAFDVVFGKIANDDVGETVQAVLDGLMPRDYALQRLTFMEADEQYCFCTGAALRFLLFQEARNA